jgi:flagellar export protein FliJ
VIKRFRYRLQRVLDVRVREEQRKQHELAALVLSQRETAQQCEEQRAQLSQLRGDAVERRIGDEVAMTDVLLMRRDIDGLVGCVCQGEGAIEWFEQAIQTARGELQELARRRLVLERLRERDYERFQIELQRAEAIELDSVVTARASVAEERE